MSRTRDGKEIVNGGNVVNGLRENADLILPRVAEHIHVLEGHFWAGPGSQNVRRVYHLQPVTRVIF